MDPPEKGIIHYGSGNRPLCSEESDQATHSNDPHQVVGCDDCLEPVAEDLGDNNRYAGRCLHCRELISAVGGVEWRRAVRRACPTAERPGGERIP